jgi:adenylylsulfate kinase
MLTMERHIIPHQGSIQKKDRQRLAGQKSCVLWFTGLSGSGKSTLADTLEETLFARSVRTYLIDGDNLRQGLNRDLGFSPEDREENIRRVAEVARLFVDAGIVVITAFISPYRRDRAAARGLVEEDEFIEIYTKCPLEICQLRDVKGLYRKAREGAIKNFTGIGDVYEEPLEAEIVLDTGSSSIEACVEKIVRALEARGVLNR